MDDRRWGFEDADDGEFDPVERTRFCADSPVDTVWGQDADAVVTVHVTALAEVVSVTLTPGWKRSVDPRRLNTSVLSAANIATMQALGRQVAQVEQNPTAILGTASGEAERGSARYDDTPLTKEDVLRLVDAVSADLDRFSRQVSAVADQAVSAESAGRHVRGSARRGQVLELAIDAQWVSSARDSEIESELVDVLRMLRSRGSPGDLLNGPQSSAVTELMTLASDPQRFIRRLGL